MSNFKSKSADAPAGANRRQMRDFYDTQERKKTKRITIIVAAALLVLFLGALFINSNYIRRNFTAITVGDTKFSAVDFNFYYYTAFFEYQNALYSNMPDMASSMLPQSTKPHKSQIYDEETGQTWADFFSETAIASMKEKMLIYDESVRNGFTLPEDKRLAMEDELESLRASSTLYGSASLDAYLSSNYGTGMNEKIFTRLLEIAYVTDAYGAHVRDSFEYTPERLDEYYDSKKDVLDTFTYRYFLVSHDVPNKNDFDTDEEYEQARQDAVDILGAEASEILAGIKSEEDFIEAARTYDPEAYAADDSTKRVYMGELLGSVYGPWLRDASRTYGECTTAESSNGHYLVYFIDRSPNEYLTVDMRQIQIDLEPVDETQYENDENDDAYLAALAQAEDDARAKAESLYNEWIDSGATEDGLIERIAGNSADTAEDGLHENVYKLEFTGALNDWLFDPERKPGDHEIIREGDIYHIVYFKGLTDTTYHDYLADERLRDEDYTAWQDGLGEPAVKRHWALRFAVQ
jgi:hypothetical protein